MSSDVASILNAHRRLGPHQAVSYLPIRTIESVPGLSVGGYRAMVEEVGFRCLVTPASDSCIPLGSVDGRRVARRRSSRAAHCPDSVRGLRHSGLRAPLEGL